MAELKTKPTAASVEKFIAGLDDEQTRTDCRTLVELMSATTGAPPRMWGPAIIGFGDYHYVYASGREGDWFQLGFSPRKQALTLYILACQQQEPGPPETLGKFKRGVGCLYIKRLSDLHLPTLKKVLRDAVRRLRKTQAAQELSSAKAARPTSPSKKRSRKE